MDGILNIDKPAGVGSTELLNRLKRLLPHKTRLGHAGTLDPFATGVLLALVGRGTRLCEMLMDQPKEYRATITLGANTPTDDPESSPVPVPNAPVPAPDILRTALTRFVGTIPQRPPVYSALKIAGRRACDLARLGQPIILEPRLVRIDRIELLKYDWPLLDVEIACGRGTYIRAIARDLGALLRTGGYLTALRRTRVGPYTADVATSIGRLCADGVERHLQPLPGRDDRPS